MKIYVVQEITGEYDDVMTTIIKAFKNKDEAKRFVDDKNNEQQQNIKSFHDKYDNIGNLSEDMLKEYEDDAEKYNIYYNPSYSMEEVELQ